MSQDVTLIMNEGEAVTHSLNWNDDLERFGTTALASTWALAQGSSGVGISNQTLTSGTASALITGSSPGRHYIVNTLTTANGQTWKKWLRVDVYAIPTEALL